MNSITIKSTSTILGQVINIVEAWFPSTGRNSLAWKTLLLSAAFWPFLQSSSTAEETDPLIQFQIDQKPAESALNEIARRANVQMLFDFDIAKNIETNRVYGYYSVWNALQLLVEDTGLKAIRVDETRFSVVTNPNSTEKPRNVFSAVFSAISDSFKSEHAIVANEDDDSLVLEEIIVTGRKREESVQEIPVAISVLGSNLIESTGIQDQRSLFAMVPGIHYDQGNDRNQALPSVRGVQSSEFASNRTKVTSFIDGMPIIGSQGSLRFKDAAQVEIYRGPQSAAFGRSTFGGAINYVTKDPDDMFEAGIDIDVNDYGVKRFDGELGGPLNDQFGYWIDIGKFNNGAPEKFRNTDGTLWDAQEGESYSLKLVWQPNAHLEAKLRFSSVETRDQRGISYFISEEARDACFDGTIADDMGAGVYGTGVIDCDWTQDERPVGQTDRTRRLLDVGVTDPNILFIAQAQSLPLDQIASYDSRDRTSLKLDWKLESNNNLQILAFTGDEDLVRGSDGNRDGNTPLNVQLNTDPGAEFPYVVTFEGTDPLADEPTLGPIRSFINRVDEEYLEARWLSPKGARFRYVVGASNYQYDYVTTIYSDGYGGILMGPEAVERYYQLTGDDLSVPVEVNDEQTTNQGLFFNLAYDFNDNLTASFEGRYQRDKSGGTDLVSGASGTAKTYAFLPRISATYNLNSSTSVYAQLSKGNNPGGVNTELLNPDTRSNLESVGQNYVSFDADSFLFFDEETITSYEIGAKGSALGGRLNYSSALFKVDWEDRAQSVFLYWGEESNRDEPLEHTGANAYLNEGSLDIWGLEAEATYAFNNSWSLRGTFAYLNAEYKDFCSVELIGSLLDTDPELYETAEESGRNFDCYNVSGNKVADQPEFMASLSPEFRADIGIRNLELIARGDFIYEGREYVEAANIQIQKAVPLLNLSLGLRSDEWSAILYVNNAANNDTPLFIGSDNDPSISLDYDPDNLTAFQQAILDGGGTPAEFNSNYSIDPRQERTIGLRFTYDF